MCQDCGERGATELCEHPECGKKRCASCSCEEHRLMILHTMADMRNEHDVDDDAAGADDTVKVRRAPRRRAAPARAAHC